MWADRLSTFRRLFRHRMPSGEVIPLDARVNPEDFPEDRFPLFCPQCDYLLQGLPDERCPECGRRFERGRLLVEQYAIEKGRRLHKRAGKCATWTGVIGLVVVAFSGFVGIGWSFLESRLRTAVVNRPTTHWVHLCIGIMFIGMVAGASLLLTSSILSWRIAAAGRRKCARVCKAIDRSTPSFQAAQRRRWILTVAWVLAMLACFAWEARFYGEWSRYYSRRPSRLLTPLAIATGVGVLMLVGQWFRRRREDDRDDDDAGEEM